MDYIIKIFNWGPIDYNTGVRRFYVVSFINDNLTFLALNVIVLHKQVIRLGKSTIY